MPTESSDVPDPIDQAREQWSMVFPDLDTSPMNVFARLHELSLAVTLRVQENFAQYGVNRADFDVLSALRRSPTIEGVTPSTLLKQLLLSSAGLTGRLHRLERLGLVVRNAHPTDNRALLVALTDKGTATVDQLVRSDIALESAWLESLPSEQIDYFVRTLRRLRSALD